MTPRPIRRWKTFWLGLLVLTFLGWAWARSLSHVDDLIWKRGSECCGINQRAGKVEGYQMKTVVALDHGLQFTSKELRRKYSATRPPRFLTWRDDGIPGMVDHHGVTIAHWFLILLFLVPWAGFLVWRVRRMKRHPLPEPESSQS